ncbi:2-dehydropantoate 2-reductase [Schleiferilactobacillus harbinensis]|uniref:2-dehydropantoate 2-reductase n=1 Tax=Schleiferilactobacillus harbinensis TaxID=304207 RepID=A0A510TXT3_9LACO|nr:2-dehydropantoate 2-reductase [Schleiferilactobacillus harbinensis]QFR24627.1 2-dehydropantoate 2-reductase [Schleiferilactobacillus harbinensis]GEK07089.1 2-dehydropantoate 2-reductase [Schleiferilactobacillus harbinensis]
MKIAIAGAGAMGGRFGTMLATTDNQVMFIDPWADHVQAINDRGLQVHVGNAVTPHWIPAALPQDVHGSFDLIILFTKAMGIAPMLESLRSIITRTTHVMVLANGIGNIEQVEKFVPGRQIIAGVTVWSSELDGPGEITLTGAGNVTLQPLAGQSDDFFQAVLTAFHQAGLNPIASDDVLAAIWKKAALNCVLNTYTALLDCNVGEFGRLPNHETLIDGVLNEFAVVAHHEHIAFDLDAARQLILAQFAPGGNSAHYPSMYQDLAKGRPTEIDFLNGFIAAKGAASNIPTPVNRLLTQLIHGKEVLSKQSVRIPA